MVDEVLQICRRHLNRLQRLDLKRACLRRFIIVVGDFKNAPYTAAEQFLILAYIVVIEMNTPQTYIENITLV